MDNEDDVQVIEKTIHFDQTLVRIVLSYDSKKIVIGDDDMCRKLNITLDGTSVTEESLCFGPGLKVYVDKFAVFNSGKGLHPLDILFRGERPKAKREGLLLAEVIGFERLLNGKIEYCDLTFVRRFFQAEKVYVLVHVYNHFMDMSKMNVMDLETLQIGVTSENETGNKRTYVFNNNPLPCFYNEYIHFKKMSSLAATLIAAIHAINRRPRAFEEYLLHNAMGFWPFGEDRFRKFSVDKAIEIAGYGILAGKRGTRIIGRQFKEEPNQRQREVELFDLISETSGYRRAEIRSLRKFSSAVIQHYYGST